jgi:hypothetical protein
LRAALQCLRIFKGIRSVLVVEGKAAGGMGEVEILMTCTMNVHLQSSRRHCCCMAYMRTWLHIAGWENGGGFKLFVESQPFAACDVLKVRVGHPPVTKSELNADMPSCTLASTCCNGGHGLVRRERVGASQVDPDRIWQGAQKRRCTS